MELGSDGELSSRHSKEREHLRAIAETSTRPPPFSFSSALEVVGKISEGEKRKKNHEIRPAILRLC